MSVILQLKALIATNPNYTPEVRKEAVKLLTIIDEELDFTGYEVGDAVAEQVEKFNNTLCEIDDEAEISSVNDPDDDAGTKKSDLLEGFDDTGIDAGEGSQ